MIRILISSLIVPLREETKCRKYSNALVAVGVYVVWNYPASNGLELKAPRHRKTF